MEKVKQEYMLNGLDCGNCARKIEDGVAGMKGIETCSVNFATSTLTVTVEGNSGGNMSSEITKKVNAIEPHIKVVPKEGAPGKEAEGDNSMQKTIARLAFGTALGAAGFLVPAGGIAEWLLFFLAYLIIGGDVVYRAFKNILQGRVFDEHFLMTIATVGAFIIGQYPEGVAVMLFYQIGELFQGAAVNRSRKSISELMDIRPDYANLKTADGTVKVSPETVACGDVIIIRPGEKIPLDGKVVEGRSMVDTSALTGESVPRDIAPGKEVLSGFVNKNGVLEVEVEKEYHESTVSKILDLVQNAGSRKAKTENFITKFAKYYTPFVVIVALLLAFVPPLIVPGVSLSDWVYRALVFLVISCPCALVVSIPLGFFGGIGAASKAGILVKGSNYLEALNDAKYAVFDKTGTLTKGEFAVVKLSPAGNGTEEKLLAYAAAAEYHSGHPIAESIREAYGKPVSPEDINGYSEMPGYGVRAVVNGKSILAGNAKLMKKENIRYQEDDGVGTVIYVAADGAFIGSILIGDDLKEDAEQAIFSLKKAGIKKTVMLTGDAKEVGEAVGKALAIDEVHAELLPQHKVDLIEELDKVKLPKEKLLFAGDGINDTPVLARADIGIAMGGLGSDAAVEAADIVIMTDQPSKIAEAIQIAKRTRTIVWQNIIFALGVKGVFLILGAFGIATMWEAVFSDVGVTLLAVLNAMRVLNVEKM
ncbi:heavy metal translocating P-type ATPase [Bacillus glycinifermentans]|uniref:Cd(2+)-exporting ATPase n=1 Tax=Bacillus glycinifermentans TaxID=1664069 RepID=A0A0T6BRV5_9BACI|nr:heavy metal translocating P-type ATPase [Bacillus glycinifermentans]ATH93129.1 cadmium-translocating P-type ATPase [Bacillus glycinifermentans]KRT94373.1 cadmium transporter [Bacillus glycinifermentans]MEC0485906.1 heavy metal translocating P-type ATPase [Bacillus glycinifermentans]MEC0496719.1 heavy metal translocating P-type ATPase [Bacillus glycinifermentans]MEC0542042.1 heavy metal translocating P-type ATPase [Bacillus glycinifermentans]